MNRIAAIALAAFLSLPALAQKLDNAEEAALKQLAQTYLAEIEAGKMGASKAKNPDVKKFGQKMADDHALMLKDLQTLAKSKGVALPTTVNARDFAEMKKLEHASGDDFDRKYMQEMVKDHEKHVKNTETLAAKAKDPDFKSAVQHASAKIREHLQHAKSIADSRALSPK